jgi:hypothetical protein
MSKRVVVKEENGQYLNDDAVVALAMTTLNNASTVREYLLQLADLRRTLVSACARRLDTALHRRDA